MKNILNITSGINGGQSYSTKLANVIIGRIESVYPGSSITTYDLAKNPLPHLEAAHFNAFQVPAELRTTEQQAAAHYSDTAVADLLAADFVVIGVPLYNFSIPSTLKAWIDHIARAGITFSYGENGPKGMVTGKKVFLALASGGVYSEGPMQGFEDCEAYLRNFLGWLGMNDVTAFRAEGVNMPQLTATALPKAVEAVNEYAF